MNICVWCLCIQYVLFHICVGIDSMDLTRKGLQVTYMRRVWKHTFVYLSDHPEVALCG